MLRLVKSNLKAFQKWKTTIKCYCWIMGFELLTVFFSVRYSMMNDEEAFGDDIVGFFLPFMGFLCGIVASSIGGNDYRDGTVRNKLVTGYNRIQIYLANFITSSILSVVLYVMLSISIICITLPFFKLGFGVEGNAAVFFIRNFSLGIVPVISSVALYNLIVMVNTSKAKGLVICLVTAYVLAILFSAIEPSRLMPKEMNTKDVPDDVLYGGSFPYYEEDWTPLEEGIIVKNDNAMDDPFRSILVFLNDAVGDVSLNRVMSDIHQDYHYCIINGVNHRIVFFVFNFIYIALLNVIGCLLFKRKKLK